MTGTRAIVLLVTATLTATAVAQDRPSNFRKTNIRTGGTMSLDFEHIFKMQLEDVTLQSPLGGVMAGATAPNLELDVTSLYVHLAGAWADENIGVEAYVDIGAQQARTTGLLQSGAMQTGLEVDGDWGFMIGGGGRYRFFNIGGFQMFIDGWGRWSEATADTRLNGVSAGRQGTQLVTWQASLYLTYEFRIGKDVRIAPYGGLLVSGANYKISNVFEPNQKDVLGVLGGLEMGITPNVGLYAEGRFISQTAVAAGVTIGF